MSAAAPFLTENSVIVLPLFLITLPAIPISVRQGFEDKIFSEYFRSRFSSRDPEKSQEKLALYAIKRRRYRGIRIADKIQIGDREQKLVENRL